MMFRVAFFILFCVCSVHGQSFEELNRARSEGEITNIILAAREDHSSKKEFFGIVRLGFFYLDGNNIKKCDSIVTLIRIHYSDFIQHKTTWGNRSSYDYYSLLRGVANIKNDIANSRAVVTNAYFQDKRSLSYLKDMYQIYVNESKPDSAEIVLLKFLRKLKHSVDVSRFEKNWGPTVDDYSFFFEEICRLMVMQRNPKKLAHYLHAWGVDIDDPLTKQYSKKQQLFAAKYLCMLARFTEARMLLERLGSEPEALRTFAHLEFHEGRFTQSLDLYTKLFSIHRNNVNSLFPLMSEDEREHYVSVLTEDYEMYLTLVSEIPVMSTQYLWVIFDFQIFRKGLLLNISKKLSKSIQSLNDLAITNKQLQIARLNDSISLVALKKTGRSERERVISTLREKKAMLEKEITQADQGQGELLDVTSTEELTSALQPGTCLVEVLRFHRWQRTPIAMVSCGSISYAALVVKPEMPIEFVLLSHGDEFDEKFVTDYRNSIRQQTVDRDSYIRFWKDIDVRLTDVKKVYLSPDGIYNLININTLENPTSHVFMLDKYEIVNTTSPRDLADPPTLAISTNEALLVGDPRYFIESPTAEDSTIIANTRPDSYGTRTGTHNPLPGTRLETKKISELIEHAGGTCTLLLDTAASEATIKSVVMPPIVHFATHGFFLDKDRTTSDPLINSGLILAGADNSVYYDGEDGILTALEITSLDLKATQLVVLSACETGLGDVRTGDGIYGLQRAFRIAGVNYVITSLWNVNSAITGELMAIFYEELIRSGNVIESFRKAQAKLRSWYDAPYYWGAFKIIGT